MSLNSTTVIESDRVTVSAGGLQTSNPSITALQRELANEVRRRQEAERVLQQWIDATKHFPTMAPVRYVVQDFVSHFVVRTGRRLARWRFWRVLACSIDSQAKLDRAKESASHYLRQQAG